jgi:branched-chain amino acid transport system permease protein/urea transport system permease protein
MGDLLNVVVTVLLLLITASGLAVIFGLMGVINFAHGEFVMIGAFVTYFTVHWANFWIALLLAPLVVAAIGLLVERSLIRRLYSRPLETILATWGLSIVIRELARLWFGPQFRSIPAPISGSVQLFGTTYPTYRLVVIGMICLLFVMLLAVFRYTQLGLVTRAVIENPELAASRGVNVHRTYQVTFAFGAALAGLAGAIVAPLVAIYPEMGSSFIINPFLAVIVAGAGSFGGVAVAAGIFGVSQSLAVRFISPVTGSVVILLLAITLLRIRPGGLLRRYVR